MKTMNLLKELHTLNKIFKIIESCDTREQFDNAYKLLVRHEVNHSKGFVMRRCFSSLFAYADKKLSTLIDKYETVSKN